MHTYTCTKHSNPRFDTNSTYTVLSGTDTKKEARKRWDQQREQKEKSHYMRPWRILRTIQ